MFKKKDKNKKEGKEEPKPIIKNDAPFRYFDITYIGNIEEFKALLKKSISFDFKDMGNNTFFIKVKKDDFENFSLFIQACKEKSTALKKYQEISEEVYGGALSSLDNILHGK